MRVVGTIISIAALGALASSQPSTPPVKVGVAELTIGGIDDGRDDYSFSITSGLAFDLSGRIVVSDMKDNLIRVYKPDGTFAFKMGGKGAGPGEFSTAIGVAFSPDGLVWSQDEGNLRYNAYSLGPTRGTFSTSMRFDFQRASSRLQPIAFDASGRLIAIGSYLEQKTGDRLPARFTIDRTGKTVRVDTIALPPADSLGNAKVKQAKGEGATASVVTMFYYQPYGAELLFAQSPNGSTARAVSSRYDIAWRDPNGKLLRTIRRDVTGPTLSPRETKIARDRIDGFLNATKMTEGQLPKGMPDRKAPIRYLAFDQLGRLWVDRAVPDGAAREADLYEQSGKWIAIMRWPKEVQVTNFGMIAATKDGVLGVATDSLEVQSVVRLRFK